MLALVVLVHLLDVQLQIVLQGECLRTMRALVHFVPVGFLVRVQCRRGGKVLGTVRASVVADAQMGTLLVHRLGAVLREGLVAVLAFVPAG